MKIYNSLTRKKESFKPLKNNLVRMYVCGPTVYGPSHLGHAVTYIRFDFIRRVLEYLNYKVRLVINITDIHDDILKKAREFKIPPQKLADKYKKEFHQDLKTIKMKKTYRNPRVSNHLKEIISLIKKLIQKGYAYETEDGVYFDVSKFKNYGKLSGIKLQKALAGTRVRSDKYEKEEVSDFALWKKENDEWLFSSPWGKGRPGWHIECSAMSEKYLKVPFDIHGGALDLKFPHHENEIAQSEAVFEKKLANFFMHSGLLYINGQKMSKSLGNYFELREFLKNYSGRFLRFFVLFHHYRSLIDFNQKILEEMKNSFFNLNEKIAKLLQSKNLKGSKKINTNPYLKKIKKILSNDFNSPLVLSYLFDLLKKTDELLIKEELSEKTRKEIIKFLKDLDKFFVFLFPWQKISQKDKELILKREKLRKEKKFILSDKIRSKLQKKLIFLEDTSDKTFFINLN